MTLLGLRNIVPGVFKTAIRFTELIPAAALGADPTSAVSALVEGCGEEVEPVIGFHPSGENIVRWNEDLVAACEALTRRVHGVAALSPGDVEGSLSEIAKYSEGGGPVRAFSLDCGGMAEGEGWVDRTYQLLGECAGVDRPVVLVGGEQVREALLRILLDRLLHRHPTLQLVLTEATLLPGLLARLPPDQASSGPSLPPNLFFVSDFSDPRYSDYLLGVVGPGNLLLGAAPGRLSLLAQLEQAKVASWNPARLLGLARVPHWRVEGDRVTVVGRKSAAVGALSSILRHAATPPDQFMVHGDRLMRLLAEETLARLAPGPPVTLESPTGLYRGLPELEEERRLCVVSIVRSGDILLEAFRQLRPGLRVGKILIQRDETTTDKRPVFYYKKLPADIAQCQVAVVDPMLGTGGSLDCAMGVLTDAGVEEVTFVNLYCCEEGLERIHKKYPKLHVVTLYVDLMMDERKYLIPGIGDFGDRYYGTVKSLE